MLTDVHIEAIVDEIFFLISNDFFAYPGFDQYIIEWIQFFNLQKIAEYFTVDGVVCWEIQIVVVEHLKDLDLVGNHPEYYHR